MPCNAIDWTFHILWIKRLIHALTLVVFFCVCCCSKSIGFQYCAYCIASRSLSEIVISLLVHKLTNANLAQLNLKHFVLPLDILGRIEETSLGRSGTVLVKLLIVSAWVAWPNTFNPTPLLLVILYSYAWKSETLSSLIHLSDILVTNIRLSCPEWNASSSVQLVLKIITVNGSCHAISLVCKHI